MVTRIILEGPDGAGKTTLASTLCEHLGATYIHNGLHEYPFFEYMQQIMFAMEEDQLPVVWDRFWLSNLVYSPIMGGTLLTPSEEQILRMLTMNLGGEAVICMPSYEVVLDNWKRRGDEYVTDEAKMRLIYHSYFRSFGIPTETINPFDEDQVDVLLARLAP
jgi:thymidylate kinase